MAETLECLNCGTENRPGARFCAECGSELSLDCDNCGTKNRAGAKFCDTCGHALGSKANAPHEPAREPQQPAHHHAERRQLTVMFCDMVGSTALSDELDPEDLRDIMRDYIDRCAQAVEAFDGFIAQTRGDGLMVYFGYPQAHEDDAERAVRSGLAILQAIKTGDTKPQMGQSATVQVRIGIHTGLVVAGEIGGADRQADKAIVGDTPNIAARLEALAAPDTMVISEQLQTLAGPAFEYADLGEHTVKGIKRPLRVFQVLRERSLEGRFDSALSKGLTPLVGRDHEIALLIDRWEKCKEGEGQVVMLSGEPGIGKSRIVQALREHLSEEQHTSLLLQCSPYYRSTAFYPIIRLLERAVGLTREESREAKLVKLERFLASATDRPDRLAPLFADILSIPKGERYEDAGLSPQQKKDQTINGIARIVTGQAATQPIVVIFEDIQWIDPTSLEVLDLLIDQVQDARILLVVTLRSDYERTPAARAHMTTLTLNRLTRRQSAEIVANVTHGQGMPAELADQIVKRTDGVPLFLEELTKTVIESQPADQRTDYVAADKTKALAIPATLNASLLARLDRLGDHREVAQIGAAIGREFSYGLLSQVAEHNPRDLDEALRRLLDANILVVIQRGPTPEMVYSFKHALLQDASYGSMLRRRRQQVHARIASVLQDQFPNVAQNEPELLAHHWALAGIVDLGIRYFLEAGRRAVEQSALVEAVAHFRNGLELLEQHPDQPDRNERELELQLALGIPLIATAGYAARETRTAYARARTLSEEMDQPASTLQALFGLWGHHWQCAELDTALDLARSIAAAAEQVPDTASRALASRVLGSTMFTMGDLEGARTHFEQSISLAELNDTPVRGGLYAVDPGIASKLILSWTLWLLGYPDFALQRVQEALAAARQIRHPYTLAFATFFWSICHLLRGEPGEAREAAEEAIAVATEQRFPFWLFYSQVVRGWALMKQGDAEAGRKEIEAGVRDYAEIGPALMRPMQLGLLAAACEQTDEAAHGLRAVEKALELVERTDERTWEAEIYRLRGSLLLSQDPGATRAAMQDYDRALTIARDRNARSLELRAATSMANLLISSGRPEDAESTLRPVYNGFNEGAGTADLRAADALLRSLAERRSGQGAPYAGPKAQKPGD